MSDQRTVQLYYCPTPTVECHRLGTVGSISISPAIWPARVYQKIRASWVPTVCHPAPKNTALHGSFTCDKLPGSWWQATWPEYPWHFWMSPWTHSCPRWCCHWRRRSLWERVPTCPALPRSKCPSCQNRQVWAFHKCWSSEGISRRSTFFVTGSERKRCLEEIKKLLNVCWQHIIFFVRIQKEILTNCHRCG